VSIASHHFSNELRRRPEGHPNHRRLTPPEILEPVRRLLGGIELDPCTEPNNPTGADRFYYPPQDGCALSWSARSIWVNPPYSKARERWVVRCVVEAARGTQIVLLIPSATETRISQLALRDCTTFLLLRARVRFGVLRPNRRQEAASHGSVLFGFNVDLTPLGDLGVVAKPIARLP
jgi:hypothetical protein